MKKAIPLSFIILVIILFSFITVIVTNKTTFDPTLETPSEFSHTLEATHTEVILPTPNTLDPALQDSIPIPFLRSQSADEIRISPSNYTISGIVQDMNTEQAVADINISIKRYNYGSYTISSEISKIVTDTKGHFQYDAPGPGQYILTLNSDSLALYDPIIKEDVLLTSTRRVRNDIILNVGAAGSIKGRVYDAKTKRGISGVRIVERSFSTATDQNGCYVLQGIPSGPKTILAVDTGAYSCKPVGNDSHKVLVIPNEVADSYDFILEKGFSLNGKIVNEDGTAIQNGKVYINQHSCPK